MAFKPSANRVPTPVARVEAEAARRIAVDAAMLAGAALPPTQQSVLDVARHFGGIQIDPTRTVERTQHIVLWGRIRNYDRGLLERALADRKVFEYNAFIVPVDRVPELLHAAKTWATGTGNWSQQVRDFMAANADFRKSILDQLRADGPLQSRDIDDSQVKVGWRSTGWTHGKNTSRMLEFMSVKMDVVVSGRVGQERLWDLAERVIPASAPRGELTDDEYEERRVMRAMHRFGIATFPEIRLRAYGLGIPAAKALLARLVEQGKLEPVRLTLRAGEVDAFALPGLADSPPAPTRTTLVSPFDPLVYDRERTQRLFGFEYKLEMYTPAAERKFGHYVLPVLHRDRLVGRLDAERDRKTNELIVRKLHWESKPDAGAKKVVDQAIATLAEFVRAG